MAIPPGKRLGPYEILAAIGAGGTGEVYRARDTLLERTVEHFKDPDVPTPRSSPDYNVSLDGQRFLMLEPVEEHQTTSQIIVVQKWIEELKQKAPLGR
jgi:hypothetical protein